MQKIDSAECWEVLLSKETKNNNEEQRKFHQPIKRKDAPLKGSQGGRVQTNQGWGFLLGGRSAARLGHL